MQDLIKHTADQRFDDAEFIASELTASDLDLITGGLSLSGDLVKSADSWVFKIKITGLRELREKLNKIFD